MFITLTTIVLFSAGASLVIYKLIGYSIYKDVLSIVSEVDGVPKFTINKDTKIKNVDDVLLQFQIRTDIWISAIVMEMDRGIKKENITVRDLLNRKNYL